MTWLAPVSAFAQSSVLSLEDQRRLDALIREQARQDAEYQALMKAARQRLLRSAPLPAARNPLLGRWTLPKTAPAGGRQDELSQLFSLLSNPERLGCQFLLGEGITEFKPASWSSIDSFGDDSLGPIHYTGDGKRVWAVPETGVHFLAFDIVSPDCVTMVGFEDCTLVRVGATPNRTATPSPRK